MPKRIEFAPQVRLLAVEHLAPRFFAEVVGYEYAECLITDESDLSDFTSAFADADRDEVAEMLDRLEAHYLIDGRSVGTTRIVDLLEYLQSQGIGGGD